MGARAERDGGLAGSRSSSPRKECAGGRSANRRRWVSSAGGKTAAARGTLRETGGRPSGPRRTEGKLLRAAERFTVVRQVQSTELTSNSRRPAASAMTRGLRGWFADERSGERAMSRRVFWGMRWGGELRVLPVTLTGAASFRADADGGGRRWRG